MFIIFLKQNRQNKKGLGKSMINFSDFRKSFIFKYCRGKEQEAFSWFQSLKEEGQVVL